MLGVYLSGSLRPIQPQDRLLQRLRVQQIKGQAAFALTCLPAVGKDHNALFLTWRARQPNNKLICRRVKQRHRTLPDLSYGTGAGAEYTCRLSASRAAVQCKVVADALLQSQDSPK